MLESKIQRQIIQQQEANNKWVLKILKANKTGIPDLLLIDRQTAVASWIECKAVDGVISPKQMQMARELREFCEVSFMTKNGILVPEPERKEFLF